ncbi:alpha-amylase family glycosyl hydrolase [Synechococcus sp. OH20]
MVPYLKLLGISDLYASPIFQARSGSTHGYDVVDPRQINQELGGSEKFELLWETLNQQGIGWIQDIVPNHMAYDGQNQMLMDVLESGPNSDFIDYFDVNWNHSYLGIKGRILAPFLGDFYDKCLESGQIQLRSYPSPPQSPRWCLVALVGRAPHKSGCSKNRLGV